MRYGFIKVAAITPHVRVADPYYNRDQIIQTMKTAEENGAKILVYPELAVTGYTCGDLFQQTYLIDSAEKALHDIIAASREVDAILFVGTIWEEESKLYNVMVAINQGEVLGVVPKSYLANSGEFAEKRYFEKAPKTVKYFTAMHDETKKIPFGTQLLFKCHEMRNLVIAAEICGDLHAPVPPSSYHALAGATVLVNSSASDELAGKDVYRRNAVTNQSGRLLAGYICASAGEGESTTDLVFGGQNLIAENGNLVAEATRFVNEITYGIIDVDKLAGERMRNSSFVECGSEEYLKIPFTLNVWETEIPNLSASPFIPEEPGELAARCEEILTIQAMGLKSRLSHTGSRKAVIGISGGLDSTLALIVTTKAFDLLGYPREDIHAITMPCFGTTDRTYQNACVMSRTIGAHLQEIPIKDAVRQHFQDIGHDESVHDVTYENSQARERTQVLMDYANQIGGMVIGTGDLSELALGWATYNGDHMSMYGVNAGVPKTLVRHLVRYYAETCGDEELSKALFDVVDTPVSPELLPPEEGKIAQKTEDLVGPYELHDFFLYYVLRYGFEPGKIYRMAQRAFDGVYDAATIHKWLRTFYRRFFTQQFKRSCLADGPKVGSVGISPRGDLRMPSDASSRIWLDEMDRLL